jgi:hypothetical protein
LVLKFVGPPPHHVFPRIGIVSVMLLVVIYSGTPTRTSLMIEIALGFVLLFWYVRE